MKTAPSASRRLATASLCAFVVAADAAAQSPGPTIAPPVTVVEERAAPSLTVPSLPQAQEEMRRVPGGAEIVPAERFRDGKAATVKDVLDFTPGVFAQPKYGQEDARLSIRGSGLSRNFHLRGIRLMQDGVPVNLADGGADFQEIDPLAAAYVEVFKGANALQYGVASLGGAVNFVSPTGRDFPILLLRGEFGSFGTFRSQIASGQAKGPWDYWVSATGNVSDGYRDHTDQAYARLNGNVGYRFGDKGETRFFFSGNHIDNQIVSSLTRAQALADPKQASPGAIALDTRRDIDSWKVANRTTFLLGDEELTLAASYHYRYLFHPLTFAVIDNVSDDVLATARLRGKGSVADHRNEYTVGFNVFAGRNDNRQYANVNGHKGAPTNDTIERSANLELYGENRFYVSPTVALVGGAQFQTAYRRLDDNFLSNGDDSGSKTFVSVNPKIGFLWDAWKDVQVFGNVSRASEPPTFSELNPSVAPGFANLKAQKSWTVELGTRGKAGRIGWDLSVYHAWLRDELQLFVVPGAGAGGFAVNADKTIHRGVELGIDATVLDGVFVPSPTEADRLELRVAYTFSDFRFQDDPTFGNNKLPGAPNHYIRAELMYRHPLGFHLGPTLEWVPQAYYVDNANTKSQMTKPYALLGAKAGWKFENGLTMFVDGRNLLDKTYISNTSARPVATPADALYNPGDGRAIFVGLEFRW